MLYPVNEKITGRLLERIPDDLLYINLKALSFVARKMILQQLSIAYIVAVSELKVRLSIN